MAQIESVETDSQAPGSALHAATSDGADVPDEHKFLLRRDLVKAIQSLNAQACRDCLAEMRQCRMSLNEPLNKNNETILHFAIEAGFVEAVEMLSEDISVDMDVREKTNNFNPLHLAAKLGLGLIITRLLLHPLKLKDSGLYDFNHLAVKRSLELIRSKLDAKQNHQENVLHLGVMSGDLDTVCRLLDAANVIQTIWLTNQSRRPSVVAKAFAQNSNTIGQDLTEASALTNCRNADGQTPLHLALVNKNTTMAKLLLSYGADGQRIVDSHGRTAFYLAKQISPPDDELLAAFRRRSTEQLPEAEEMPKPVTHSRRRRYGHGNGTGLRALSHHGMHSSRPCTTGVDKTALNISRLSISARAATHKPASRPSVDELEGLSPSSVEPDEIDSHRHMRPPSVVCKPSAPFLRPSVVDPIPMSVQSQPPPALQPAQIPEQPAPPKPLSGAAIRKASLLDPHEYYPMAASRRGICLIINNMNYWHSEFTDRNGCDKDEKKLEYVFRNLGFLVKLLRNLSSQEMAAQLRHLGSETDHSQYDCFVACVMTHGKLGQLYGVHGDPFPVHELTSPFTADRCPSLAGKPKAFFIQACRGDDYHMGVTINAGTNEEEEEEEEEEPNPLDLTDTLTQPDTLSKPVKRDSHLPSIRAAKLPKNQRLIPVYADFLLSYATVAGFKAQRDPNKGSIYVQTLAKRLEKEGRHRGLLDIVTSVHREVSQHVFRQIAKDKQSSTTFQQMPEARHTLTRKVQFV